LNKLVLIFDYFKEAFHINKKNKSLYKPQIALIAVKVLLLLFVGIGIYSWIGVGNITSVTTMRPEQMIGFALSQGFKLVAIILGYALVTVVIESGLLNMYKKAVQGSTEAGDFMEGLSKYFLKLLLGEILIIICCILLLPFYLILGVITLTVGLTVIPIVAGVFLSMWKVSLVMNDTGIFTAVKDSFRFAKRNFIPLTVLQIIHWSFSRGMSSGSSGGNFNVPDTNNLGNDFGQGFGNDFSGVPGMEEVIRIIKLVIAVLLPIISIAIIAGSIIAMIFEVFFSLTLFVAYKNDFKVAEKHVAIEETAENEAVENHEALEVNDDVFEETPIEAELDTQNEEEVSGKEVEQ
jgi:hypothetical protein